MHYSLTDEALNVLRLYRTSGWESELSAFRSSHGALLEIYQRRRRMREIPIRTSTAAAILLYLGDAANKLLHLDGERLVQPGFPNYRA